MHTSYPLNTAMHPNIHDTDRFAAKHMYCLFSLNIPLFLKCISEDCHHKYTLLKKYKFYIPMLVAIMGKSILPNVT